MEKIDFVILWVDGSDKEWLNEKNKYSNEKIDVVNDAKRYRDYDLLKYWFRGVEQNAPWVNKIHLVTYGHLPKWLDTTHPKLNIVNHKDFIPAEYLPTFNSHTIELNLHRIKELNDKFVYFNDDMLILNKLMPEYFFKNGLPRDSWQEDILVLDKTSDLNFSHILVNVLKVINSNFDKRRAIKSNFFKWFNVRYGKGLIKNLLLFNWRNIPGFYNYHMPSAFLKSTFEEVWEKEEDVLSKSSITKFRDDNDINQYVMRLWQIYSGNFSVMGHKEFGKVFTLSDDNDELLDFIITSKKKMVCINDGNVNDFQKVKLELMETLEKKFPEKSCFEK